MRQHALIFNVHNLGIRRPSGPYRIATVLREHHWDVEVVEYTCSFSLPELQELVRSRVGRETVFIGFSCFFAYWEPKLDEFVRWVRATYGIPCVIGSQSVPRMNAEVDYFIHGYGEHAILRLARHLAGNEQITFDPRHLPRRVISANAAYPAFPMKSLAVRYEARDDVQPWEWLTIEMGRGCKFKCPYCNFPVLGVRGDYSRDYADFEAEMRENHDLWGVKNYYIADETFNDSVEKLEKFAKITDAVDFNPYFSAFIRADLMIRRPQDRELLAKMGVLGHFYGVETMNEKTSAAIGKRMATEQLQNGLLEARSYFKRVGRYRASMGLVVGLPHETVESQIATLSWVEHNWQGESIHVWPLEIPLEGSQDVLSRLSVDYQKYGYRPAGNADFSQYNMDSNGLSTPARVKHGISNLDWENDHMSYRTACMISDEFYARLARGEMFFGISMFTFGDYMYPNQSMDEAMATNSIQFPSPLIANRHREYIDRKLSIARR